MDVLTVSRRTFLFTLLLAVLVTAGSGRAELPEDVRGVLPAADKAVTHELSDSLAREAQLRIAGSVNNRPVLIHELLGDEATVGYVIDRWAFGRYDPFQFRIVLDDELTVVGMEVLDYRSQYGGEIQLPGFLRQFAGIKDPERIQVGKAIDGVSGATLSTRGITEETRYTVEALQWLAAEGNLPRHGD